MKRYDDLKQFMAWAMHTLRVGGFAPDSAFDVLRISRRLKMLKIEFKVAARRFDDPDGLSWCDKLSRIHYKPMQVAFETASSFYFTPEIADLKLDGKPLPDDFVLTERRIEALFPRLEFYSFALYAAIKRGQISLQEALEVIGDRAVYELRLHEYMDYLCDPKYRDKYQLWKNHKSSVETAMLFGRNVPESLLKDYPDLKGEKVQAPPKMAQRSLFLRPKHSFSEGKVNSEEAHLRSGGQR